MDGLLADPRLDPARRAEILYWSALAHARAGRRGLALTRLRRSQELAPEGWFAEEAAALQMRLSR